MQDVNALEAQPALAAMKLSGEQLVGFARGFSRIFWGIGMTLLLMTNTISVGIAPGFILPWHVTGLALVVAGAVTLRRTPPIAPRWARHVNILLATALLELYFVPFTLWWRQMPAVTWYTVNMFMLIGVTLLLLLMVNRLVTQMGQALGDRILAVKGRLCEGTVALFVLGPAFALLFYTLLVTLRTPGDEVTVHLANPRYIWPVWVYFFFMVPFLLTMGTAWDCKERCLRELEGGE